MNKLTCIFLFMIICCKAQTNTNSNDYQNMRDVIDKYILGTVYYETLKENGIRSKFYITNFSSNKMETIESNSLKKQLLLNDGVYIFYIKDIRYAYTHIYIKDNGKVKIFESINCPADNLKIRQAVTYIENNLENENKENIIDNISNYSKHIKYFKIDPQSKFNCF
ncbi:hypothetical protein [Chryseobacterium sp. Mn2064]|uniref:hypothetical protein n=1 Tax=Chryseobacterium sp. Mn2064 TaxID=3395263 RepID=UPI003BD331DF